MSPSLPKTQKVILIEENGESVDVLKYVDSPTPEITSPHDVIVKNQFAGVNFIEAYFRKGIYPVQLPAILGREASGVVAAVGDEVTKYKVGDKIAYLSTQTFAQYTKIQDSLQAVLPVGKDVSDEKFKAYGAILVQGLTALTFITEAHNVQKGEYILVWAAAGGVGRLLVQLISARGAHVIAIASTDEKLAVAKELGAEFVINSTTEDINAKVKEITGGKGVAATFDSVGKDSFDISFEALARKGTFVSYGNSSGVVPPLPINKLSPKNIKLTRPQLFGYVAAPEEWEHYTSTLLKLIDSGELKFELHTAKLEDYKQVATNLESRKTTGKIVLEIPQ
ncbi:NADPH:quinone reductase [Scheffersomyces xylosifermentans]|uniref:NADPH:quinone reductase n=1 Tax=Scheffersomyces xylosifermentans TaxID=1304137 RepID=UPI00315D4153